MTLFARIINMASDRVPLRLALSYVVDWIVIAGIAAVGEGFNKHRPNHRPFSPVDPGISFPFVEHEKVSTGVLLTISLVIPLVLTAIVALVATPGHTVLERTPSSRRWRQKLWEWNSAWMGLALALALTFFFTQGLKNLMGKPRPDLLSRCDLDPATVQNFALGGFGSQLPQWNLLVSSAACRQKDLSKLDDGFASFPSGHSSFSWAGMSYLALFLCSKFGVAIPYLLPYSYRANIQASRIPIDDHDDHFPPRDHDPILQPKELLPNRKQAAAPPVYLLVLPLVPISVAIYVASSRFSDFRHHTFDIIFGSLMGLLISWISFRMYQLPISRGAGWAWGPRNTMRAWGIGIGVQGYGEDEQDLKNNDIELGPQGSNGEGVKPLAGDIEGSRSSQS